MGVNCLTGMQQQLMVVDNGRNILPVMIQSPVAVFEYLRTH